MSPGEKMIYAAAFGAEFALHGRSDQAAHEAARAVEEFRNLEESIQATPSRPGSVEMYKAMRYGS